MAAAAPGDVIEVQRGNYRVNLLIDKPLTLRGLNRPTLNGGLTGDTIRVTSPDVVIEGLIVSNSGSSLKDQTNMQQYYGEAVCLRAMVYLDLIRAFGDIPMKFESTKADLSKLSDKPLHTVILTHFHADHAFVPALNHLAIAQQKAKRLHPVAAGIEFFAGF